MRWSHRRTRSGFMGPVAFGAGLAVTVLIVAAGAAMAQTEPPSQQPPHPPPIVGTFQVTPNAGPAGSKVTFHGFCGFPGVAPTEAAVPALLEPDNFGVVTVFGGVGITGPWGSFSVEETIPATPPGGYIAAVACINQDNEPTRLPNQLFEVTSCCRRGGGPVGGPPR